MASRKSAEKVGQPAEYNKKIRLAGLVLTPLFSGITKNDKFSFTMMERQRIRCKPICCDGKLTVNIQKVCAASKLKLKAVYTRITKKKTDDQPRDPKQLQSVSVQQITPRLLITDLTLTFHTMQ